MTVIIVLIVIVIVRPSTSRSRNSPSHYELNSKLTLVNTYCQYDFYHRRINSDRMFIFFGVTTRGKNEILSKSK